MSTDCQPDQTAAELNRTSTTRMPITTTEENHSSEHKEHQLTGYQFCEMCQSYRAPNEETRSTCNCEEIERGVAGGLRFSKQFDTISRIAEHAVLTLWAPNWDHDISITATEVVGRMGGRGDDPDIHNVKVDFDGSLWGEISEEFTCDAGSATINSIIDDGSIYIQVTLSDDEE